MATETLPCPSCKRANTLDGVAAEAASCTRCGCELATLAHLREASIIRAEGARAALANGGPTAAAQLAAESWSCRPDAGAAACGFLASVLLGNLASAELWKQRLDHK